MLVYSSVNDEFAKLSDAGLLELSIVESEQHNSAAETPAAHFRTRNSQNKDFKHYVNPNRVSQDSVKPLDKPEDTLERKATEKSTSNKISSKEKAQEKRKINYLSSNRSLILA